MAVMLYVASSIGLILAQQADGDWAMVRHALLQTPLTSVAVTGGTLLVGSRQGIFRSVDQGRTWLAANDGLAVPHVRWLSAPDALPGVVFAGTEPAAIFASRDGGRTWERADEVISMRDRFGWFLPYSPAAGCVRDVDAVEVDNAVRAYAAVEVGGVLVSEDRGVSWHLAAGSDGRPDLDRDRERASSDLIHPDVHSLSVHSQHPGVVTAATGGGLFRSVDAGSSWRNIYRCYVRAVWVDPGDPRHILAGPADGVARNGRIERSRDGGKTWEPASDGTTAPWPRHMVERFRYADGMLFGVLSSGELWAASPSGGPWRRVLPEVEGIRAVAAGPLPDTP